MPHLVAVFKEVARARVSGRLVVGQQALLAILPLAHG